MVDQQEKRTNLGRGLAALFGDETEDYASLDKVRSTKQVPIEHIHPNTKQPRRHFDAEALTSLADSISQSGLLQPILVRRHPVHNAEYEIVAGERRWRASQQAKLHEVPVVIRDFNDAEVLQVAIIENVQRQDLTPIEEATSYRRLMDEFGHKQDDVAKIIGKSRSHIANMLRLLTLPEDVQDLLEKGDLSAGHARALVGAEDPTHLAEQITSRELSVRETERLAKAMKKELSGPTAAPAQKSIAGSLKPRTSSGSDKDADTLALERDLSNMLGLTVSIDFHGQGGSLKIAYDTLEQLDDVLHRLTQASAGK
ncbi:ParB/RepB/Spo0J family partition protein [Kiloniella laminariae]|uniref:ParB/RepB/Spo0J family partition protein n=1 Tax=Kiloniella laminariae TaxID=454162 RepID=A0ABT4LJ88_9PROT|nr:ParB/RepB/Spo0J family partition protein [Kiloniella laminariae]MCZ4281170.1 ParB/RepB/Spo0J family partition protein [Kiloniella laminariae]